MLAAVFPALAGIGLAVSPAGGSELDAAAHGFRAAHRGARVVSARTGGLAHASGFAAPGPGGEAGARAFLLAEGRPFGVGGPGDIETRRVLARPDGSGLAVFRRRVRGLPVFGGEISVGWRRGGAVYLVNGSAALATVVAGGFGAPAAAARAAALASAPGPPSGPVEMERGWREHGGRLFPVWRVSFATAAPPDAFVAYVDAETGRLLYRLSKKRRASPAPCRPATCAADCILTYCDSPVTDPSGPPVPQGGYLPLPVNADDLSGTGKLSGPRAAVYNCAGGVAAAATCTQTASPDGQGSFVAAPDPTFLVANDRFAEQAAYSHILQHSRFIDSLDSGSPSNDPTTGIVGFIAGYVNVYQAGIPLDDAFFSPTGAGSGIMVFGQGSSVDLAYDAEIAAHELTHAAVEATAAFEAAPDELGVDGDPDALNEGTADTFAFANPNVLQPCLSPYFAAGLGLACLRNADNVRTCRGNGSDDEANPGRVGEPHDDGQIWTGFTWALFKAAMDQDALRADGQTLQRDAMAAALFRALEGMTSRPSFEAYGDTVEAELRNSSGPQASQAADFAACTRAQRDIDACAGRTVPIFSGERARGVLPALQSAVSPGAQQYFIDIPCGAKALHLTAKDDTGVGMLFLRYGAPVTFEDPGTLSDPGLTRASFDWLVTASHGTGTENPDDVVLTTGEAGENPCPRCDVCGQHTPLGSGRWYFLPAGRSLGAFELSATIDVPGVALPQRTPYQFGPAAGRNLCAWGQGPSPGTPEAPVYYPAQADASCAPRAPTQVAAAACSPQPPAADASGCGCASGGAAGALLPLGALALRRRARAADRPRLASG